MKNNYFWRFFIFIFIIVSFHFSQAKDVLGKWEKYEKTSKNKMSLSLLPELTLRTTEIVQTKNSVNYPVSIAGMNFGIGGEFNYKFNEQISFSSLLAYEMQDQKGSASQLVCNGNTSSDCYMKSQQLKLSLLARYYIPSDSINLWVGLGYSFRYRLSIDSNTLYSSDINYGSSIPLSIGIEHELSDEKHFIPFSLTYEYSLNTSEEVPKISSITVNVGYGYRF